MRDETRTESVALPAKRRRRWAGPTAGLVAVILLGGIGGPAAAQALRNDPPPTAERLMDADAQSFLGGVTLDELAQELAAMGLRVEVRPDVDALVEDEASQDPFSGDGYSDLDETVDADPFAGMSDEEIDALSDDEFYEILDGAYGQFDDSYDDQYDGQDEQPIGDFAVNGDELDTSGVSPEIAQQGREIWTRFTELIPADQRQMVVGFELMDEAYEGAHVYPTDADPSKWVIGVSLGLGSDLDFVLIHEFGHLLTLQAKEVPPGNDFSTCTTYFTGEGCALSGSTFAGFVARFWPPDMLDELSRIDETEDWDAIDAFYEKYSDRFVTDYATTNPAEDLAETFAVFVSEDRPTHNTIADQKVLYLWNDPAMVTLRDQIRAGL